MGHSLKAIRDLQMLAQHLREQAQEATLPGYREKMLKAAAEVEAQVDASVHVSDNP